MQNKRGIQELWQRLLPPVGRFGIAGLLLAAGLMLAGRLSSPVIAAYIDFIGANSVPMAGSAPTAEADAYNTDEDTQLVVSTGTGVLSNDTDPESDPLTAVLDTPTVHGSLGLSSDGSFTYTPDGNYYGNDSFTYHAYDGSSNSNTATVTLTINSINDAPVVTGIPDQTIGEGASFTTIDLNTYVSDVDNTDAEMAWSYSGNSELTVGIVAGVATITKPNADWNGAETITFRATDPGALFGEDGAIFTVTAVNDAPSGTDTTISTTEDIAKVFASTDFGFDDPKDFPKNNFSAVIITTLPGQGSLKLNTVAVTAGQSIPVANIPQLVFTPAANGNGTGYASFTFQVQDDGGGSDLDLSANTLTIDVTSVNDAPAGANKTLTILEDTSKVFVAADFGFTDPADVPANNFSAVKITTLPAKGSLKLNGGAVSAGNLILVANIPQLVFTPDANEFASPYTSFTFQVQDNGGTANSGANLDPTANTMTINVTPVNDAPAGTDKTVTILEDNNKVFAITDFGFSDATDTPQNAFSAVKITTLPGQGSLKLSSVSVTVGQLVPAANIPQLVFTPAANGNGTGYASFTFQVQDDGGTANGGVNLDQAANTLTIDVTSVNDAPVGVADHYYLNNVMFYDTDNDPKHEKDTYLVRTVAPGVLTNDSDVDGDTLTASINTLPSIGTLKMDSGDGSFEYRPNDQNLLQGTDSFVYTLSDGHGGSKDVTVNITIDRVGPAVVAQWLSPVTALAGNSNYYGATYDASTATVPLKVFVDDTSDVAKVEFKWYDHTQAPNIVWYIVETDYTPTMENGKYVYTATLNTDSMPFVDDIQLWAYTYDVAGSYTRIVKVNGFDYYSRILINHSYNVFLPFIRR
ncbi:MAG: tandem-95 repeat protein [Bellilinea sp.]